MPKNGHLTWKAIYQPGKVVAVGYKNGKRVSVETVETTKPAYKLVLSTERQTFMADGQDLAVITKEVQDLVPNACPMLNLSLTGEGRILGVGNGDPSYLGSNHPNELDCHQFQIAAFNGLAQVIVQSCHQPSRIQLTCNADRLKDGTISVIAE